MNLNPPKQKVDKQNQQTGSLADRDIAQRLADHNTILRLTGDRKAAIRSYCAGNRWLTENAQAVGNWS